MLGKKEEVLRCNCCGELIKQIDHIGNYMDHFQVEKTWNYFSKKDLTKHSFTLCEKCYDQFIQTFVIPAEELAVTEVFKCLDESCEIQQEKLLKNK